MTAIKRTDTDNDYPLEESQKHNKKPKLTKEQENTNERAVQRFNNEKSSTEISLPPKNIIYFKNDGAHLEFRIDLRDIKKASYFLYMNLEKEKAQEVTQIKPQTSSQNSNKTQSTGHKSPKFDRRHITENFIIENLEKAGFDKNKISVMLPQILKFLETHKILMNDEDVEDFCLFADYLCFEELERVTIEYMKERMTNPFPPYFPFSSYKNMVYEYPKTGENNFLIIGASNEVKTRAHNAVITRVNNAIIDHLIELILYDTKGQRKIAQDMLENDVEFLRVSERHYEKINLIIKDDYFTIHNGLISFSTFFEKIGVIFNYLKHLKTVNLEIDSIRFPGKKSLFVDNLQETIFMLDRSLDRGSFPLVENFSLKFSLTKRGYTSFSSFSNHPVIPFIDSETTSLISDLQDTIRIINSLINTILRFPKFKNLTIDLPDAGPPQDHQTGYSGVITKLHDQTDRLSLGVPIRSLSEKDFKTIEELKIPEIRDTVASNIMNDNYLYEIKSEESKEFLKIYTSACNALSTYPLESLELFPDFLDEQLCDLDDIPDDEDEIWLYDKHFGVSDTKMPEVKEFFEAFSKLNVKKIMYRLPHCFVLGYIEECLKNGLKGLEEIHLTGCVKQEFQVLNEANGVMETKNYAQELERILKTRKNLKYSITVGDLWDSDFDYIPYVIEGNTKK